MLLFYIPTWVCTCFIELTATRVVQLCACLFGCSDSSRWFSFLCFVAPFFSHLVYSGVMQWKHTFANPLGSALVSYYAVAVNAELLWRSCCWRWTVLTGRQGPRPCGLHVVVCWMKSWVQGPSGASSQGLGPGPDPSGLHRVRDTPHTRPPPQGVLVMYARHVDKPSQSSGGR